jgi:hypothetical protein
MLNLVFTPSTKKPLLSPLLPPPQLKNAPFITAGLFWSQSFALSRFFLLACVLVRLFVFLVVCPFFKKK